jgi:hypothetical protein
MFWFQSKKADVLSHWYALVPDFQTTSDEFYTEFEQELKLRQVVGLSVSRQEFVEGSLLSDKRVYLRMIRERFVFDICAAPFGTSYFFSCRFAIIPPVIRLWEILVFLVGLGILFEISRRLFGSFFGIFVFFVAFVAGAWLLRNSIGLGLEDLDRTLTRLPVIGALYERFLRRETYYRLDTRLMYHDIVLDIMMTKVANLTDAKGIKLLRTKHHNSVWGVGYRSKLIRLKDRTIVGEDDPWAGLATT